GACFARRGPFSTTTRWVDVVHPGCRPLRPGARPVARPCDARATRPSDGEHGVPPDTARTFESVASASSASRHYLPSLLPTAPAKETLHPAHEESGARFRRRRPAISRERCATA